MFVVGTAGHVDHGKSSLVKALTGTDPDRWREEQERGMTIDLGFAWMRLPSGREISIVDVPGHERFIKNMLAGVGGIDAVLFVIAADEGVMPQTREHLAIISLLGIEHGIVVLTKADLVEEEWLELVKLDVEDTLQDTPLSKSPILTTSTVTGAGLADLVTALDTLLEHQRPRDSRGRPRLPIDRVFTVGGFGTVVTGTLIDGELEVGQTVEIQPGGLRTRIRSLQTHQHSVPKAGPGSRVAANLAGLERQQLKRGDVLTKQGWLRATRAVDVRLHVLESAPHALEHNMMVDFFSGAAVSPARLLLLDADSLNPGTSGLAQARLEQELAVAAGDRYIVRLPSPSVTIGGGIVVDTHPPRHKRLQPNVIERLKTLEEGSPEDLVGVALQRPAPVDERTLAARTGLNSAQVGRALDDLVRRGQAIAVDAVTGALFIGVGAWQNLVARTRDVLAEYHRDHPLRWGMPREELKSRLALTPQAFNAVVDRAVADALVDAAGPEIRLPEQEVVMSSELRVRADALMAALRSSAEQPPALTTLRNELQLPTDLIDLLERQGLLVRVSDDLAFEAHTYASLRDRVIAHLKAHGPATVAEIRDALGTSRKYTLALLEYFDQQRLTVRRGDERSLRTP